MELLSLRKVSKSFNNIQVLYDVDLELRAGEIHCLVGENGSGKSTIVKVLTGVYPDYTGEILVEGKSCKLASPRTSREMGIFAIQQHRDLVPTMDTCENLFLGNYIYANQKRRTLDRAAMKQRAKEYLESFRVNFDLNAPVQELKVSEQGIIAICKAIASNGKILLVDEASAPLDSFERSVLYDLLKKLRDEGKGIIYISHHLEEIFNIGDRVTVLRNGANIWTKSTKEVSRNDLITAMTGNKELYRGSAQTIVSKDCEPEDCILQYKNVCSQSVQNISFQLFKGEVIGFAGLEGSGKHSIANMFFGLESYTSGELLYKGKPLKLSSPLQAIKKDIGFVPTDRKVQGLVCCRSLAENITLPMLNKRGKVLVSKAWLRKAGKKGIEELGIKAVSPNQLVQNLSGGNQQKVLIAKWLWAESDVLYLTEPTEGIDVGARSDIYRILKQAAQNGLSIVIFSSDIDELMTLCDRIFTLAHGRMIGQYEGADMNKNQILSDILSNAASEEEVGQ